MLAFPFTLIIYIPYLLLQVIKEPEAGTNVLPI
ncbi:MAG: hypothetical protein ACJAXX_003354 [Roseivirga sp.]